MPEATTTVAAPTGTAQTDPNITALAAELAQVKAEARLQRVTAAIAVLVNNNQITEVEREAAIARAVKDETYLAELQARPAVRPGGAPLATPNLEANASDADVLNGFKAFGASSESYIRGNDVSMQTIAKNSANRGQFYAKHRTQIMNAAGDNTVATGLKQQVILQEAMFAFQPAIAALGAFSTVHSNVPLQGTDIINVPFYDLEAAASTDWVAASGYVAGESTTDTRAVTVNKRKYGSVGMTSSELARQPMLNIVNLVRQKTAKLGIDVFADVLSVVTLANYGAAVITKVPALFDGDDIIDLRTACNKAEWPEVGRSLILGADYEGALLKDTTVKEAMFANGATPGVARILGFDLYRTEKVPANAQNLVGFAAHQSAILVATSPIEPAAEVRPQLSSYVVVTDPATGVSFTFKSFGSGQMDNAQSIVECNYGYVKGNAAAIKRITSA